MYEAAVEKIKISKKTIWSMGLAMFAMFFGAGNIVFPLALGQVSQDQHIWGILGMVFTAVLVPLAGLFSVILFRGDYHGYFQRVGKWPGFILICMIMGLIGPFGGIPRCIAVSHATLASCNLSFPFLPFSLISCLIVFLFTFRPNKMLPLLGYVLTPLLLLSLGVLALKGVIAPSEMGHSSLTVKETFVEGFLGGYNTMDLFAAFFFSSVALFCLKGKEEKLGEKNVLKISLFASMITGLLLTAVYILFSYLAARHSLILAGIPKAELLGAVAKIYLGPWASMVASLSVAFACLTTEIALAATLAQFMKEAIPKGKMKYLPALVITLVTTLIVSSLGFDKLSLYLVPILQFFYPALIVLSVVNILHKLFNFKPVKLFFYGTFLFTLLIFFGKTMGWWG